jgi:replicative DNA helicase
MTAPGEPRRRAGDQLINAPGTERAILGAALRTPTAAHQILNGLHPDDFTTPLNAAVHAALTHLLNHHAPITPDTLLAHLRSTGAATQADRYTDAGVYIAALLEAGTAIVPSAAPYHRRILAQHTYRRAVLATGLRWAQAAHADPDVDLDQLLDQCYRAAAAHRRRARAPLDQPTEGAA